MTKDGHESLRKFHKQVFQKLTQFQTIFTDNFEEEKEKSPNDVSRHDPTIVVNRLDNMKQKKKMPKIPKPPKSIHPNIIANPHRKSVAVPTQHVL